MKVKLRKPDTKKIFQFAIILIIIYALCGLSAAISGSGSDTDPYKIGSEQDLKDLASIIDAAPNVYLYVLQTANISLADPENIIPKPDYPDTSNGKNNNFELLGSSGAPFYGMYDGSNYTITGLYYQEWNSGVYRSNVGLFGETNNSVIENVRLTNARIWGTQNVGTLIGKSNNTTIKNCLIENTSVNISIYSGGLVGYFNDGLIENSSVTGNITAHVAASEIGGIVGRVHNEGTIKNCYFAGTIVMADNSYVGGIVGNLSNGTVSNCYSVCELDSLFMIGGIAGAINKGKIENCYSVGKTTAMMRAGGIVGVIDTPASAGTVIIENNIALNEQANAISRINRIIGVLDSNNPIGTNYGWEGMKNSFSGTFTAGGENGTDVTSKKIWSTFPNNEWAMFDTNIWKLNTYDDYKLPVFKWQTEELQEDASYLRATWNLPQISNLEVVQSDESSITLSFEIMWNDEMPTQANWDVELFYSESADIFASDKVTAVFNGNKYTATIQNLDSSKEYHAWGTTIHQTDFTFINGTEHIFMLGSASPGNNIGNGTGNVTIINPNEKPTISDESKQDETKPNETRPEGPKQGESKPNEQKPNMWQIYLFYIIAIFCFIGRKYLENRKSKHYLEQT